MTNNVPQFTRADSALVSARVAGHLAECANVAREIMLACEQGAAHAREFGTSREALDGARQVRERIDALYDFIAWQVERERAAR